MLNVRGELVFYFKSITFCLCDWKCNDRNCYTQTTATTMVFLGLADKYPYTNGELWEKTITKYETLKSQGKLKGHERGKQNPSNIEKCTTIIFKGDTRKSKSQQKSIDDDNI